jgi:hypothetical protein
MTKTAETAVCACRHKRIEHFEEQPYGCSVEDCLCEGFSHETASQIMTDAAIPRQTIKPDYRHTPGPWFVEVNQKNMAHISPSAAPDTFIAEVWSDEFENGEPLTETNTADAQLIAAAPELLAALEYMNNFYLSNSHKRSCQADPDPQRCPHCKAEAAMKKARGQQ